MSTASNSGRVVNPEYTPIPASKTGYKTFDEFYPFYLGEHNNSISRRLHLFGTSISQLVLLRILASNIPDLFSAIGSHQIAWELEKVGFRLRFPLWKYIAAAIGQAYFLAWVGHFWFEKNKPATFTYPLYSLRGDLRMLWEVVTGKRKA